MIRTIRLAISSVNRLPEMPQLKGGQRRFALVRLRTNPLEPVRGFTDATSNASGASDCAFANATIRSPDAASAIEILMSSFDAPRAPAVYQVVDLRASE